MLVRSNTKVRPRRIEEKNKELLLVDRGQSYVGEQKSDFGLQGGNTVHKRILEFVLYYIRFDLQGRGFPLPVPPPPTPTYEASVFLT